MRKASSFNRSSPALEPQPRVLVICEDTKSSKQYLEDAVVHFRVNAKVQVIHCGRTDPKGIVQEAARKLAQYDVVYCVLDRDSHPLWADALGIAAQRNGLEVIASYPCFEFWLILHFQEHRRPYGSRGKRSAADCCVQELKGIPRMAHYEKGGCGGIFKALLQLLPIARANAVKVVRDAERSGDWNPSTKMHVLIERLEELGAVLG